MLAPVVAPDPTLDSMEGDAQASTIEFFKVWSQEVLSSDSGFLIKIGDAFMSEYMRARLGKLFKLTTNQAEKVIQRVIDTDAEFKSRNAAGVRLSIEETAGFTFEDPGVPESAAAILSLKRASESTAFDKKRKRPPTISEELASAGKDFPSLPPEVFSVLETANPKVVEIEESECEALTDAVYHAAGHMFGRWNLGAPLRRKWARELHAKCPNLPLYGGKPRKFEKMLEYKQTNRSNVRASLRHMLLCATPRCALPPLTMRVSRVLAEDLQDQDRVQGQRAQRGDQGDDGRAPQAGAGRRLRRHLWI